MCMPEALYGRIIHRLHIPESSSDVSTGTTKSSFRRSSSDNRKHRSDQCAEDSSNDYRQDEQHHHFLLSSGFIFIPNENSPYNNECLLSLPKNLLNVALNAVRRNQEVVIERYTEIHITESSTLSSSSSSSSVHVPNRYLLRQELPICRMLEVHRHGLDLLPSSNQGQTATTTTSTNLSDDNSSKDSNNNNDDNLWTLTQFWRKEVFDSTRLKLCRRFKFNIIGTIDSISPIVTLDPTHPFALIEIYDPSNTDITAIVVLNGHDALVCHSSTLPNETYIFRNVTYKAWAVPTILQKEGDDRWKGRVPSHVFVSNEADCVDWQQRSLQQEDEFDRILQPVISPMNLLTAIQGKVVHVETKVSSSGPYTAEVINYIDLLLQSNSKSTLLDCSGRTDRTGWTYCRLYLTHFPMSTALQWSLRHGAIVQANNVRIILDGSPDHFLHHGSEGGKKWIIYDACLRSTLVLLECATEALEMTGGLRLSDSDFGTQSTDENMGSSPMETQSKDNSKTPGAVNDPSQAKTGGKRKRGNGPFRVSLTNSSAAPWVPYRLWKIPHDHLETVYRNHVEGWYHRNFPGTLPPDTNTSKSVLTSWITHVLLDDWTSNRSKTTNIRKVYTKNRPKRRCPYTEFFEHHCGTTGFIDSEDDDTASLADGRCPSSFANPVLVDLATIRSASQNVIMKRIVERRSESQNAFCVGWTGSIVVEPDEILHGISIRNDDNNHQTESPMKVLVGGFVREVHSLPSQSVAAISDSHCQIPVNFSRESTTNAKVDDFVMGIVKGITISCLCLGSPTKLNDTRNPSVEEKDQQDCTNASSVSLPALQSADTGLLGGCSLIAVCGFIFVISIQIQCLQSNAFIMDETSENREMNLPPRRLQSIEECLISVSSTNPTTSSSMQGTIVRRRFHSKMNSDGSWKCCKLFVASGPKDESSSPLESEGCFLQSFEYTLSVLHSTARNLMFNRHLEATWPGAFLSEAQKVLGSSFWALGNSGRTCAVTFGGSEDFLMGSRGSNIYVHLVFPKSAVHFTDRGYVRLASTHEGLDAIMLESGAGQFNSPMTRSSRTLFDFEGGVKVFNGMLCRRPTRRNVFGPFLDSTTRVVGELCTTISSSATPSHFTISELFRQVCQDLQEPHSCAMNPSLVRRISHSTFLGVNFCHVQTFCRRCNSPLVATIPNKKKRQQYGYDGHSQPSFWHLPHPQEAFVRAHSTRPALVEATSDTPIPIHIQQSTLQCSNKCAMHNFGVKWECSGILDDGTGQATLYSDGDVALTLMGMSSETIQWIEQGIWSTDSGFLLFKKSIPPSYHLRSSVSYALSKKKTVMDPIRLLPPDVRAEYLLQKHCRSSSRQHRTLDYYVRCKPLADKMRHLNHTTINTFFVESIGQSGVDSDWNTTRSASIHRGESISYTLPALKLELVDCGVPSQDF